MTSIFKLSNLEKYTSKMMNYIHETFLTKATPKEILECSGDLIDNFTGNGITKHGNVQIDENGIASYFVNNTDHVKTNLTSIDFFNAFEFQIKFKPQQDKYNYLIGWYSLPQFEISYQKGSFNILEYKTSSQTSNYFWYKKFKVDIRDWCYFHCKREDDYYVFTIYDNDFNVLYSAKSDYKIVEFTNLQPLILGQINWNDPIVINNTDLKIDLSETWFKDKDGNLISSWNK